MEPELSHQDTVEDFGVQWSRFTENRGYYASQEALQDLVNPLLDVQVIRGRWVADVGAGTGRYTALLHKAGARGILAMEPSKAFEVLKRNTANLRSVSYLKERAENIPNLGFDLIFCIGVLQFLSDPRPALISMGKALAPGGRLFLWVYGKEGNLPYLTMVRLFRMVTPVLPAAFLDILVSGLLPISNAYASLCRHIELPLAKYIRNYYSKLDQYSRKMVIFDQLNPRFAKYYSEKELKTLIESCGFRHIQMHHRLNYSWSVLASYT
jgi:SAM-dependent methyltransferase